MALPVMNKQLNGKRAVKENIGKILVNSTEVAVQATLIALDISMVIRKELHELLTDDEPATTEPTPTN